MAKLIYSAISSLDGYVADQAGDFDWATPDEEVLAFVIDLELPTGTYLYGRRMYQTMGSWETARFLAAGRQLSQNFAELWRAADKVVYSTSLATVSSTRTRIERTFDPESVRAMKERSESDLTVGGAHLAGQALAAGLVDECHLLLVPVIVGGGTPALPAQLRRQLDLLDQRRFGNGVVHLHYRVGN